MSKPYRVAEVGGHRCPWQIGGCEFQIGHDGPHSWRQDGDVQTWHIPQSPKPPLLPDDDTAVERLAAAIESLDWLTFAPGLNLTPAKLAAVIIAALREGGQP